MGSAFSFTIAKREQGTDGFDGRSVRGRNVGGRGELLGLLTDERVRDGVVDPWAAIRLFDGPLGCRCFVGIFTSGFGPEQARDFGSGLAENHPKHVVLADDIDQHGEHTD